LFLRQLPAVLPVGPRAYLVGDELLDQVGGSDLLSVAEGRLDVPQELDIDGAVLIFARERARRASGVLGPSAAGQIGNGQQRAPVVGSAIVQDLGDRGVGIDQLVEVVGRPPRRLAT